MDSEALRTTDDNSSHTERSPVVDGDQNTTGANVAKLFQTLKDANALVDSKQTDEVGATQPPTESTGLHTTEKPGVINANDHMDNGQQSDTESSASTSSDLDINTDNEADSDGQSDILQMIADDDEDEEFTTGTATTLVTRHELSNPPVPELTITQLPDTAQLCDLGAIHSIVGSSITIQAHISGETHVLDSESLVAFENRKVLGMISDVFGPVARPMYTVRFNSTEEIDVDMCTVGRSVFYAPGWARMLATDKLRFKGTDASNEYDEEVGSDAMEFSDDEAEQAFKKQRKKGRGKRNTTREVIPAAVQSNPPAEVASVQPTSAPPASAANGRKLQSYEDMYDADYGF
ncbi:NAF1-domain-containing protein [Coemansia reversa NRRL 1564]|uniref:H/ACA ribonucleoprotein complex subunit n=1 Tax=Coemansia reversa (strain ATCC 12441 / NRRL 1564) TaxID=763665 RepID=A0A2G5BDH6_COERN|nr:NAF1-domain-containing protein [Coemansia reversa NRRL 1564]|eukprot:PIA17068.1 NAF1-domain-containing protein [Coemansia reversa NRRL 1564]